MSLLVSNSYISVSIILLLASFKLIQSEIFTSLASMSELLKSEGILIKDLKGYIEIMEDKLKFVKRKLRRFESNHNEDITNPITAFLLTKRFTKEWEDLKMEFLKDTESKYLNNISSNWEKFILPTDEDLAGAAIGLLRLQATYQLDTPSLAKGFIKGRQYNAEMSSDDCFELGRQSFNAGQFTYSGEWLIEALERLSNKPENKKLQSLKGKIFEFLVYSNYKLGNMSSAIFYTKEILKINPKDQNALRDLKMFEHILETDLENRDDKKRVEKVHFSKRIDAVIEETSMKLCRESIKRTPTQLRMLRCKFINNKNSFLKLAPLKIEEVYTNPFIAIFHDVMSDREIEVVKNISQSKLARASILETRVSSNERISKSAWIADENHKTIRDISRRVEDITGLSMSTAEALQVVNYGIGGFYRHHYDFFRYNNRVLNLPNGDRTATVLFYMNDVEQGGGTVFPFLNVTVTPVRGSAVFWYNLYESGEPDFRTLHTGCPVLLGTKWVSNKWVFERGQEFRRPCGLRPDHWDSNLFNMF